MKFSLIMATIGRDREVSCFLEYLQVQTYKDFEVIVVDGSSDDRIRDIVKRYQDKYPIIYVQAAVPGVSRARNQGLLHAAGEIIAFPDDDSWYPSAHLLQAVAAAFAGNSSWDGIICRITSEDEKTSITRLGSQAQSVNRYNAWRCSTTSAMFYRRQVLPAQPVFQEDIGPGAGTPWGCAEDAQLLIQVLAARARVQYLPQLVIYHPDPFTYPRSVLHKRGYSYGCGTGYIMGTNSYPAWFFYYHLLRTLAGMVLAAVRGNWKKCDHNIQTLWGRCYGWKMAKKARKK